MSQAFAPWVAAVEPSETARMADIAARLRDDGVDVIDLSTADPDFATPEHVRDAATAALDAGETGYPPTPGTAELRAAVARKLSAENDVPTDPEEVYVTPGSKYALLEAIATIVRPGDEVVVPDPAWVSYEPMVKIAGGSVRRLRTARDDGFVPTAEGLADAVDDDTRLLILNTPANPTGAVFSPADLRAVRDAAVAHDCWVVADEVYERIVFDGEHRSVAAYPGMAARTVTVGGFSKGYAMAGWRVGYLTGPPSLLDAVGRLQSHSVTSTAIFAQRGAAAALDGPAEPFERMVDAYETRRDALVDRLRDAGVDVHPPAGGLSAFVPVGGADDVALCERLLEDDHVALTPGTPFGREGYVRVCLTADRERIVAGLDALLDRLD